MRFPAGTVQVKANENENEVQKAEQDKLKHSGKEQAAQEKIAKLEVQLKEAKERVKVTEEEVDRLASLPPIPESDFAEEMAHAEKTISVAERGMSMFIS